MIEVEDRVASLEERLGLLQDSVRYLTWSVVGLGVIANVLGIAQIVRVVTG